MIEVEVREEDQGVALVILSEFSNGGDIDLIEWVIGEEPGFGDVEEEGVGGGVVEGVKQSGFTAAERLLNFGVREVMVVPDAHLIELIDVGDMDGAGMKQVEKELVMHGPPRPAVVMGESDTVEIQGESSEFSSNEMGGGGTIDEHEREGR